MGWGADLRAVILPVVAWRSNTAVAHKQHKRQQKQLKPFPQLFHRSLQLRRHTICYCLDIKFNWWLDVKFDATHIPVTSSPRQPRSVIVNIETNLYVRQFATAIQGDYSGYQRHISWNGFGSTVNARSGCRNALCQIICFNTIAALERRKHHASWENGRLWRKCESSRKG